MDIDDYRKKIASCRQSAGTTAVLKDAVEIAQELGREFVDPSDVLLALIASPFGQRLKVRLGEVGLTHNTLYQCARAMSWRLGISQATLATERMFECALGLVESRVTDTTLELQFGLGDLMFACIASRSRVLDTVIEDALQTSVFSVLVELEAPDKLVLMFFPVETVEDIEVAMASVKPTKAVRD